MSFRSFLSFCTSGLKFLEWIEAILRSSLTPGAIGSTLEKQRGEEKGEDWQGIPSHEVLVLV